MEREAYVLFGLVMTACFLVAAARSLALRRYASLLEGGARRGGTIGGAVAGRGAEIGFLSADHGTHRPAGVLVAVECAAPLRMELHARTPATLLRSTLGILRGSQVGVDELDRRFVFTFLERSVTETVLHKDEVREALLSLGRRGAEHVLLANGWLVAEIPMTFALPPGRGAMAGALVDLGAIAAGAESALGASNFVRPDLDEPPWPAPRADDAAVVGPARMGAFFLAMSLAFFIVGSFWNLSGRVPFATRLATVEARLPTLALLAMAGGFVASWIAPRLPALWALDLSWPLLVHASIAAVIYLLLIISASRVPEIREALGGELSAIPAGTRVAALAAAIGFGGGFAGAFVARRLDGRWVRS